ncbi:uncharacterized protein LOC107627654 [Arachis ipaensis]|uniref:uncharacterized protein LOC107627654 n=1 Tax=Arachis ipaensis TaxID=130454 RepID=UPI0007AF12B7|nr:uncharacterized protein LOC107627654 [Arachis ipaensis]
MQANQTLYGLKQAPREWYHKLASGLAKIGFQPTKSDVSVFLRNSNGIKTFVLVYVDDIIITGESEQHIRRFIDKLNAKFSLKDLGDLHYFLGVQVAKTKTGGLILSQQKYIGKVLKKADMAGCTICHTPLPLTVKLLAFGGSSFSDP